MQLGKGLVHAPIFIWLLVRPQGSFASESHPAFKEFLYILSEGCFGSQSNRKVRAYTISLIRWTSTYQADQNEKNKCYFSKNSSARDVSVACQNLWFYKTLLCTRSTYLQWTWWPWENRHSPSMRDLSPRPLGNNWQNQGGRRYFQATNKNKGVKRVFKLSQWLNNMLNL